MYKPIVRHQLVNTSNVNILPRRAGEACFGPTKKVSFFLNNKPWIDKHIEALLNREKRALMSGYREEVRSIQKELMME